MNAVVDLRKNTPQGRKRGRYIVRKHGNKSREVWVPT